ncbi:zf-HC2 domain-containing protein [Actinoplanes awajinensis]|uniref:Uncharacterized protein n=1 Tax=Actinoplanes awajinensis subsp. mycoplanecinus TaxID=135947 RepID=A0A124G8N8_9ACTN|nr:zf-HC2 domain-containing protein [Actinoplanes awajinensis]KUL26486.1 hypothetical protein ADL15_37990 [Actinoplanes awajinensis subsp. mycoplanecinus]
MTDWHLDQDLLDRYDRGDLDTGRVMAVEAHMLACPHCRSRVHVDVAWTTGNWAIIYDAVHAPRVGPAQRLLTRLGLPEHRVRLLTATPALRWSWLLATAAVLGLAVLAAVFSRDGTDRAGLLFLVVAPILPVVAVSGAYGPPADPMYEITGTAPAAGPALVLWRATAVIGAAVATAGFAALLLPAAGWYAAAWLLPALLLCTGTLALATSVPLPLAAGTLGGLWLAGVLGVTGFRHEPAVPLVFGPAAQLSYSLAAALAAIVLIRRRRRFDPGESR